MRFSQSFFLFYIVSHVNPAIYGSSLMAVSCHKVTIVQSLFESEDLMREAHRPQITDLFKKHHSRLSDNGHIFKGTVVLDGGSILYTINWRKENTFETLAGQYTKFVQKNYLLSECLVKTVFDLYPQEPTTKDSTHLHRTQRACTKIRVANDTVLDLTTPQFFSNSNNKQTFVDYLALKLANMKYPRNRICQSKR